MKFRKEASKPREDVGTIILVRPIRFAVYALGAALIAAALCGLLIFASY
ncbi:MAG: hypothetical protein ACK58P_08525 [Betaproteobacteria bacterium]|jgi:hypothetical protein